MKEIRSIGLSRIACHRAAVAAVVLAGFAGSDARAANWFWDGGTANIAGAGDGVSAGGNGTWNNGLVNWDTGSAHSAWVNTNTANFGGAAGTVTMGSALSAVGVTFTTGGYTIDATSNTLSIGGPLSVSAASGTTTFSGTTLGTASQTWTVNTGNTLQYDASFNSATTTNTFTLSSAGTANLTGTFSVAGKSTLSSAAAGGTINLSGTESFETAVNDYAGIQNVTVNNTAGTATFTPGTGNSFFIGNTADATKSSTLSVSGGTVQVTNATRVIVGGSFNGLNVLTTAGDGTLTVGGGSGTGTFTTGTTTGVVTLGNNVATGTINLNANGVLSTNRNLAGSSAANAARAVVNFNGGTLKATGTAIGTTNITANVLAGGAKLDANGFATTIAANFTGANNGGVTLLAGGSTALIGTLSHSGGVTFNGNGSISGNNSYTGLTSINAAVDGSNNGSALGATGAGNNTSLNTGGTFRFRDSSNKTVTEAFTYNGGNLIVYNDPGTTTFSGALTLAVAGSLQVSPQAQSSTTTVLSGGILEGATASNFTFVRNGAAAAASNDVVNLTGGSNYGGSTSITDALNTNTGSFSVKVSGGNDRLPTSTSVTLGGATGGGVAAGSGRLILGDATAGAANQTLAGLVTSGTGTKNAVVGGNALVSTLGLAIASGTNAYAGLLGGAGTNENNLALAKSGNGALVLTGANTYSGGTTISGGTLVTGNNAALGGGTVSVSGGGLTLGNGTVNTVGGVSGFAMTSGSTLKLAALASKLTLSSGSFDLADFTLDLNNLFSGVTLTQDTAYVIVAGGTAGLDSITNASIVNAGNAAYSYSFTVDPANSTQGILVAAVPEPASLAVLALGGLGLMRRRHTA